MKFKRSSGVLLHPTSLPGRYGIGDLGDEAYQFVDFLVESRQKLWQVFPLGHTGYGDSPYQCFSAFAGNPLLISPEKLVEKGLLDDADLAALEEPNAGSVDFGRIIPRRFAALKKAYERFDGSASFADRRKIENFKQSNAFWIGDYALFMALKDHFGGKAWSEWPAATAVRAPSEANDQGCAGPVEARTVSAPVVGSISARPRPIRKRRIRPSGVGRATTGGAWRRSGLSSGGG